MVIPLVDLGLFVFDKQAELAFAESFSLTLCVCERCIKGHNFMPDENTLGAGTAQATAPTDSTVATTGDTPTAPADAGQATAAAQIIPELTPPVPDGTVPPVAAPAEPTAEGEPPQPGAQTPSEEEELQKVLDNPLTPKFAREKIEQAMKWAGTLRTEKQNLQTEFDTFRSGYDGKEALSQPDLERLRTAEDKLLQLSSFTATPEEILGTLKETVGDNKLKAVRNNLAWEFLEKPDGSPDLDNLQVIVDRYLGYQEGETRVLAKDLLNAGQALKKGTLEPFQLHEFGSEEEFEAHKRAQAADAEANTARALAKSHAEFQERSARTQVLQGVIQNVQSQFNPQVQQLLTKFNLTPQADEPKVATEYKQSINDKIAAIVQKADTENRYIGDIFKAVKLLNEPTGADAQSVQAEINGYVQSSAYQTTLHRGVSELLDQVEKVVTAEAYRYKLMMMGYEAETLKGQNAREIVGAPAASTALPAFTQEQLSKMSTAQRNDHILRQASAQLRDAAKADRYGG